MRPGVDEIDGYRIEGHVARGRSGDVYRAALPDGPPIALKLHDRADAGRREAERLVLVDHPGVVELLDQGELTGGGAWLALPWIEGRTLAHLLATEGPLSLDRTRSLIRQLGEALDAVHAAGVVHGDLSPRNVMVDLHDRVTLLDLGAAVDGTPATVDETTGLEVDTTPRYASPEVAQGRPAEPASDRYALALIAYEALTGSFPYPEVATPIAMLAHHASSAPTPPTEHRPQLPAAVDELLLDALSKRPEDRPGSGAELATALIGASLEPTRSPAAGRSRRRQGLAVGALAVIAGSIGIVRFPDFYTRLHAAGVTDTAGAELILFAMMLQAPNHNVLAKLIFISFFLFLTSPVATHAVAHAGWIGGLRPMLGKEGAINIVLERAGLISQPIEVLL
ncbi:MAG: monovalent cation/H(+) antiporter subunit G, partial [Actinomycetota bacterium]